MLRCQNNGMVWLSISLRTLISLYHYVNDALGVADNVLYLKNKSVCTGLYYLFFVIQHY